MKTKTYSAFAIVIIVMSVLSYVACNNPSKDHPADDTTKVVTDTGLVKLNALLAEQRKFIADNKLDFKVGQTSVSLMDLKRITGDLEISKEQALAIQKIMVNKVFSAELLEIIKYMRLRGCVASYRSYDARLDSLVPKIRFQQCGNCWAYSATGPVECSYIRVNSITRPSTIDYSEKQMMDCSGGGDCSGGLSYQVFDYLKNNHIKMMTDAQDPDNGVNGTCPSVTPLTKAELIDWGVIDPSGDINKIASVDKIKEAICAYGPVACSMNATPLFQNFAGGGVFYETASNYDNPTSNHAVMIVGWDDSKEAWLLRNSWGATNWGDQGYCWIKYNTNNIGRRAAWVLVKKLPFIKYTDRIDLEILKRYEFPPQPIDTTIRKQ